MKNNGRSFLRSGALMTAVFCFILALILIVPMTLTLLFGALNEVRLPWRELIILIMVAGILWTYAMSDNI